MTTDGLLAESVDSARRREGAAFDEMLASVRGRMVLFGAGTLGRKVLAALRRRGKEPLAFADSSALLQGTTVERLSVLAPAEAASRWGQDTLFVVATFRPNGGGMATRQRELAALGCRHVTSFLPLAWGNAGVLPHFAADLPSLLLAHGEELRRVGRIWHDDASRTTFQQQLSWRLRADFQGGGAVEPNQYFPRDLIRPDPREVFVDGGAYDGDTVRNAPWPFARVLAFEPDAANAARLRAMNNPRVEIYEALLGEFRGSARFDARGTMASVRSATGTVEMPMLALDDILDKEHPTFVKLDVEGDELAALKGARQLLQRTRPIVAVCVYHRPEDLWTIPLFLSDTLPGHRLFLRAHENDGFELVAYAVPPERMV